MASLPKATRVTYEEWLRMPVVDDAIEEVVNGEIRIMAPNKWIHSQVVQNLYDGLASKFDRRLVEILLLDDGRYRRSAILAEGILKPVRFPSVQINIAEIWPD